MNVLYRIYLAVLSFGVIAGALGYKRFDKAARVLLSWLVVTWITEILAFWMAKQYGNNILLYAIGNIIQAVMLCLYFNFAVASYRKAKLGYVLVVITLLAGINNLLYFQPLDQLDTNFLIYTAIAVTALSLGSFYVFLNDCNKLRLRNLPHFWFMVIISAFWIMTLVSWLFYNYFKDHIPEEVPHLNLFIIVVNIFTYMAIGIVFLLYHKIQYRRA